MSQLLRVCAVIALVQCASSFQANIASRQSLLVSNRGGSAFSPVLGRKPIDGAAWSKAKSLRVSREGLVNVKASALPAVMAPVVQVLFLL